MRLNLTIKRSVSGSFSSRSPKSRKKDKYYSYISIWLNAEVWQKPPYIVGDPTEGHQKRRLNPMAIP